MVGELVLLKAKHIHYIEALDKKQESYEYWLTEHLRLNGVYWGLTALCLLDAKETFNKNEVIDFVMKCYVEATGGFAAFPRHDAHLLTTLSAVQILKTYDSLDVLSSSQLEKCVKFVKSNQLSDGSF